MWRIDWGKRFPEGNKDVISRGCPFSMSQVKHCLLFQFTHLVCAGIRADGRKIQNYSYFFEPHVSLFIQSYWNPPKPTVYKERKSSRSLCKSRNPFDNKVSQHKITKPLLKSKIYFSCEGGARGPRRSQLQHLRHPQAPECQVHHRACQGEEANMEPGLSIVSSPQNDS